VRLAAALIAALACASSAAADEGINLLPRDTVAVKATAIACTVQTGAIRCVSGRLSATLAKDGKVHVAKGARTLFAAHSRHLRLGNLAGFDIGGTPIECHVYDDRARTMSCSTISASGGLPRSYGFDLTDRSVVVFRYGMAADRHVVKTFQ
jgi:hypothetical protein